METSISKTEMMKPLFLKAGIPLALSIAGFIYAKITARKNINPLESIDENTSFDEEIIGLRSKIEEVKKMELDLGNQFLQFQGLKELETVLMEVKNMLVLEAANVEFLNKEISSENGRFQNLVIEYLRVVEQLRLAKLRNGMLKRKVKKIVMKNMKEKSRIVRDKNMKIDAAEEEILRLWNDDEIKSGVVKKLEDRVEELQEEKNELLIRLNAAENFAKIDAECVTKEEYNEVVKELEQLREERATEITEFIYLKWNNACLKHELMRNHEQEDQIEGKRDHLELEMNGNGEKECFGAATRSSDDQMVSYQSQTEQSDKLSENRSNHDHGNSRRKKFLHKIKKWVEGNENVKVRNEEKEKEDHAIQARKSCSSA
ncbi:protein CHUP1, chloroplastic [Euphorbia lathyris]|uniref:protein CHUP1, chloroplastic n=1 Tax=Euphorbia lathyris TaxID=212925 RepID=UPI0033135F85